MGLKKSSKKAKQNKTKFHKKIHKNNIKKPTKNVKIFNAP